VTIGASGTYKTCISRLTGPTLDSQFIYLNGPRLIVAMPTSPPSAATSVEVLAQQVAVLSANVAAQSSTLTTLAANVAAQSSTLSELSASVADLSPLSANVAALSAALSCGAGGRRLETDTSSAPSVPSEPSDSTSATSIVDNLPSRRPGLAGTLTAEQRAGMEELGQHFGLPALA
jgi:hypothetical protein